MYPNQDSRPQIESSRPQIESNSRPQIESNKRSVYEACSVQIKIEMKKVGVLPICMIVKFNVSSV